MENQPFCQQVVAVFDFDGTMTTTDSLPYFFKETSGLYKTCYEILRHVPKLICCLYDQSARQKAKESLLKSFFRGMPIDELRLKGKAFAEGALNRLVRQNALDKLKWHLQMSHRCILISANLDVYLDVFAKNHGFNDCLSSQVDFDEKGLVTGRLKGLNCIGEEKVGRLKELLGEKNYTLYAYGDSDGDKELLAYADYPFYRCF